jgi:DNA topoisomerase-1
MSDHKKFETARQLKKHIGKIRKTYMEELTSKDEAARQRATALYLIDNLALRVGNEKVYSLF